MLVISAQCVCVWFFYLSGAHNKGLNKARVSLAPPCVRLHCEGKVSQTSINTQHCQELESVEWLTVSWFWLEMTAEHHEHTHTHTHSLHWTHIWSSLRHHGAANNQHLWAFCSNEVHRSRGYITRDISGLSSHSGRFSGSVRFTSLSCLTRTPPTEPPSSGPLKKATECKNAN